MLLYTEADTPWEVIPLPCMKLTFMKAALHPGSTQDCKRADLRIWGNHAPMHDLQFVQVWPPRQGPFNPLPTTILSRLQLCLHIAVLCGSQYLHAKRYRISLHWSLPQPSGRSCMQAMLQQTRTCISIQGLLGLHIAAG